MDTVQIVATAIQTILQGVLIVIYFIIRKQLESFVTHDQLENKFNEHKNSVEILKVHEDAINKYLSEIKSELKQINDNLNKNYITREDFSINCKFNRSCLATELKEFIRQEFKK